MKKEKKLYVDLVDGKICHIYIYQGNKVVYFAGESEIEVNGVKHKLEEPLHGQDDFHAFCVETNLF